MDWAVRPLYVMSGQDAAIHIHTLTPNVFPHCLFLLTWSIVGLGHYWNYCLLGKAHEFIRELTWHHFCILNYKQPINCFTYS